MNNKNKLLSKEKPQNQNYTVNKIQITQEASSNEDKSKNNKIENKMYNIEKSMKSII